MRGTRFRGQHSRCIYAPARHQPIARELRAPNLLLTHALLRRRLAAVVKPVPVAFWGSRQPVQLWTILFYVTEACLRGVAHRRHRDRLYCMANDNNNIKELVSEDDDPTAELEALTDGSLLELNDSDALEASTDTCGFGSTQGRATKTIAELQSDLASRSETIDHLQFDIEQLRAKWLGLEKEIDAREEIATSLQQKYDTALAKNRRKSKKLKDREKTIKSLKAEIRERNNAYSQLQTELAQSLSELDTLRANDQTQREKNEMLEAQLADAQQQLAELAGVPASVGELAELTEQQSGQLVSANQQIRETAEQLRRSEEYADQLRTQLADTLEENQSFRSKQENLEATLLSATSSIAELTGQTEKQSSELATLREQLATIEEEHASEIRTIRFELGDAQETVAQHELVAEKLAHDLVAANSTREELVKQLDTSQSDYESQVKALKKELSGLKEDIASSEEKLATKNEAINCLIAELTKKSQQIDAIEQIEEVIHDIDDRISGQIDLKSPSDRDRVSRVLIGSVEGQELRFPLFKDRLTIGRTQQNDIQLKASYISRRHAVVVADGDSTRVIDWGSKNGVFVNSKRVTEHFLRNGDTVTIGTADFRYEERAKRDA